MQSVPLATLVECEDDHLVTMKTLEQVGRAGPVQHLVAQRRGEPPEARKLTEEGQLVVVEATDPFTVQVVDEADMVDDIARWEPGAHHFPGKPDSCRPSFEHVQYIGDLAWIGVDSQRLEHSTALRVVECQVVGIDVDHAGSQARSADSSVVVMATADEHDGRIRREMIDHGLDQTVPDRRLHAVDVVQHEHEWFRRGRPGEPLLECPNVWVERRRIGCCRFGDLEDALQGAAERAEQHDRIVIATLKIDPSEHTGLCRNPASDEHRLSVSGRRQHSHDGADGSSKDAVEPIAFDDIRRSSRWEPLRDRRSRSSGAPLDQHAHDPAPLTAETLAL